MFLNRKCIKFCKWLGMDRLPYLTLSSQLPTSRRFNEVELRLRIYLKLIMKENRKITTHYRLDFGVWPIVARHLGFFFNFCKTPSRLHPEPPMRSLQSPFTAIRQSMKGLPQSRSLVMPSVKKKISTRASMHPMRYHKLHQQATGRGYM